MVAIDETTESKATKSKIKTEVEHSTSLPALDDNIELDSFTAVAINETTESKATKRKIKTEVEHFRRLPALYDNIERDSFTDFAINETTESKAKKSKTSSAQLGSAQRSSAFIRY